MASKKKKRRKAGEKSIFLKGLFFVCAIFFITIIGLVLFFVVSGTKNGRSVPEFEEKYFASRTIQSEIKKIDSVIYETFYQVGVREKDILFPAVNPMHENGYSWDFAELLIRLPDKNFIKKIEQGLGSKLSGLGANVKVEKIRVIKGESVWHIFSRGFYTHKIRLTLKGPEKIIKEKRRPRIAIIIDDLGYKQKLDKAFIHFDLPLSLSILPHGPYTEYAVKESQRKGRETLLHMPMEPNGYPDLNSGPGSLLTSMNNSGIRKQVSDLIRKTPGIKGVNNHMGSKFTQRRNKMIPVLNELKKRKLFFVDSRTTTETVAFNTAKEIGVPAAKKDVFLDHEISHKAIRFQVERLMGIARYSGSAIGIGHPYKETYQVLKEYEAKLKKDFVVVPVSKLVK